MQLFTFFNSIMLKMFNVPSNISIDKDIILHENIGIITDYFFNCFENNIYHEVKNNTNYKIDKTNIKEIFTLSVNHYLLESAQEQGKDINYINNIVSNKPYEPVIDNICPLVRQYFKDKEENKQNFNKILFRFIDLLLEYCGLRKTTEVNKKDNKEQQTNQLINILIQKYIRKYNPKRLNILTKAGNLKKGININTKANKIREKMAVDGNRIGNEYEDEKGFLEYLFNKLNLKKLRKANISELTDTERKELINGIKLNASFCKRGKKVVNKVKNVLLPIIATLITIPKIVEKITTLIAKTSKILGISNILNAERGRVKVKNRMQQPDLGITKNKEQKQTRQEEQKQEPEKLQQQSEGSKQQSQEPQKPVIDNNQPQPNKENEKRQEQQEQQEQIKQQEELRRKQEEQRIKAERESLQKLKEERERFEKQQRELNKKMEDSSKSVEKDGKEKSHQQEESKINKKPEDGLGAENSDKDEEKDNSKGTNGEIDENDNEFEDAPNFGSDGDGFFDFDKNENKNSLYDNKPEVEANTSTDQSHFNGFVKREEKKNNKKQQELGI